MAAMAAQMVVLEAVAVKVVQESTDLHQKVVTEVLVHNGLTEHTTQVAVAVVVKILQTVAVKAVTEAAATDRMPEVEAQMVVQVLQQIPEVEEAVLV
jgi:hypothetical protein